ncbi:MAG: efflux RND transporter periplasmic adaptor subunit [Vicinamibacteria bacterium]
MTRFAWALAFLVPIACGTTRGRPAPAAGAPTATVRAAPAEDVFLLTGETAAVRSLDLTTPATDTWELQIKWLAENGADVRAGDRVIEFDNTAVRQSLEERRLKAIQTRLERESRQASLAAEGERKRAARQKAEVEVEKARLDADVPVELQARAEWYKKQVTLREHQTALEKAIDDERAFEASSKADVLVLRIAEEKAGRELDAAEKTLTWLSVTAPRDGIFIVAPHFNEDRAFQQGDAVWPRLRIASIPELSEMEVLASLPEVDHGQVAVGQPARCVLDTYPEQIFEGKVEEVATVAEAPVRGRGAARSGFRVRLSLAKTDPARMRPGMSVRVEVIRKRWNKALLVPRAAVRTDKEGTFVKSQRFSSRTPVRIAACLAVDCVVDSGLGEGDRVALP